MEPVRSVRYSAWGWGSEKGAPPPRSGEDPRLLGGSCVSFWCSRTYFFFFCDSWSLSHIQKGVPLSNAIREFFQVFLLYFYVFLWFCYTCKSFPILGIHHVAHWEVWMQCSFLNEEIIVPSHLFFPIPFEMPPLSYILCSDIDINLFLNIRNRVFCLFHWSVNVPVSHSLNYLYLCH